MKGASILLLSLACVAVCVQCYGGRGFDPLQEFIKTRRTKRSVNYAVRDVSVSGEYKAVYAGNEDGVKEGDEILGLPGQPQVNFSQYSGYVSVDPVAGRALFYYFAESEDSSTKPLVLWLNGGPGCSSLGAGAMTELGPFRVNPDGKTLWYNQYSWNNVANVIFLESPAGVGFSYSNRSSDYTTGDTQTAEDAYTFLVNWLERFPEYKTRDFYITGESYAGHYVPQLAALIQQNNKITNQTVINLKGIAIGNALIDDEDEGKGYFDYIWTHALISDEIHEGIVENCNFSAAANVSETCDNYTSQAEDALRDIFPYNIYAPWCSTPSNSSAINGYDPCSDDYVDSYLNTPQVQTALHANAPGIGGNWSLCNYNIGWNWQDSPYTLLPTIKELMADGIRVWIYSGDTDSVVPITATRNSMPKLEAAVKTPWYPWYLQQEVGGYVVEYENVTFVSVRGAGHFVPSYQPQRALTLFSSFLAGILPPSSS
ncbi:serine carboxypeptidase-like 40 [Perilla frutescens var. hirtella]|nr:serine carboxypeptidase-like 40 [Perilla frutescens var. hirtella]KAH6811840.1 serine carboxypeptidase-like 40 [Perilla frutescens var. frutescens]